MAAALTPSSRSRSREARDETFHPPVYMASHSVESRISGSEGESTLHTQSKHDVEGLQSAQPDGKSAGLLPESSTPSSSKPAALSGPSASFLEPNHGRSKRKGVLARKVSTSQDKGTCTGDSSCPRPSSLCRQTSRVSNRPPSPHFPSMALALSRSISAPGAVYIDWDEDDPECPFNWPSRKKWVMVICCFLFTGSTAIIATAYNASGPQVEQEFGISSQIYLLGNMTYLVSVATFGLVIAPFSELLGRKIIFIAAAFVTALMLIPQALATNIYGIIIPRIVQGAAASAGNSVVGGIVADCFATHNRGLPMGAFALVVFVSQGIGPPAAAYTVQSYSWRICFWWQFAVAGLSAMSMLFCFDETRGPVLLSRRAAKMRKECGNEIQYRCRADDEKLSVAQMVKTSTTRPLIYLFTEPIVMSFTLWIAMLWGTIFMSVGAIPIAFNEAYGWTTQQGSLVLLILAVGGCLGWLLNLLQERLYDRAWHRHHGQPPPEARLYLPAFGAVVVPAGLFWFAWGCRNGVHPAVPIIGLVAFAAGVYPIYLGVFVYLADCYQRYSSSALAAQSFMRNLMAGTLALAVPSMYYNLGSPAATSVLAGISAFLGLTPFILLAYGSKIRSMSRVYKALQREEEELEEQRLVAKRKAERKAARELEKEEMKKRLAQKPHQAYEGDKATQTRIDAGNDDDTPSLRRPRTTGEAILAQAMEARDVEKQV